MRLRTSHKLILGLLALVGAYGLGRYSAPARVEVRTVEVVKEVESRRVARVTKETRYPDGREVTLTKEREITDTNREAARASESVTVSPSAKDWSIGVYSALGASQTFVGTIDRTILPGIRLGVYTRYSGAMPPEVGVGLRVEF